MATMARFRHIAGVCALLCVTLLTASAQHRDVSSVASPCATHDHDGMGGTFLPITDDRRSFQRDAVALLRKHAPVDAARISSSFGPRRDPFRRTRAFHGGVDFAGPLGTPIRAAASGVVVQANYHRDYGNVIRIDHGNGSVTLYAHNHKLLVKRGQRVAARQQIAQLGSTGRSTGPHLHFEVHLHGERVDPQSILVASQAAPRLYR